jgi:hypothetical protein
MLSILYQKLPNDKKNVDCQEVCTKNADCRVVCTKNSEYRDCGDKGQLGKSLFLLTLLVTCGLRSDIATLVNKACLSTVRRKSCCFFIFHLLGCPNTQVIW